MVVRVFKVLVVVMFSFAGIGLGIS